MHDTARGTVQDMDGNEQLRRELVAFVKRKLGTCNRMAEQAEDIVNEAFLALLTAKTYTEDKMNFGYLSVSCLRIAYRAFKSKDFILNAPMGLDDYSDVLSERDFVDELIAAEDTSVILSSMLVLRQIERIIVTERYFGNLRFAEIAQRHNIKLNTVLSHHRRALDKLRGYLQKYF